MARRREQAAGASLSARRGSRPGAAKLNERVSFGVIPALREGECGSDSRIQVVPRTFVRPEPMRLGAIFYWQKGVMSLTVLSDYEKSAALMADFHHVTALATRRGRVLAQRIFYGVFGFLGLFNGALLLWIGVVDGNDTATWSIALLGLLFGAFFAVRGVFYYQYLGFISGRVMKKRLAGHVSEVRYTFGDTDLTVDDALEHCVHPYHVFMAVCESKRIFALLLTPRVGYMIDKRDMKPAEIEALRAWIGAHFEKPLTYYDV